MNYNLTNEWQALSTIMGADYDNTKQYRVHNNCELPAKLCLTEESAPTSDTIGRIYPAYCDIYIDVDLDPKIRVIPVSTGFVYNIEVTEVATAEETVEDNNGGEE